MQHVSILIVYYVGVFGFTAFFFSLVVVAACTVPSILNVKSTNNDNCALVSHLNKCVFG